MKVMLVDDEQSVHKLVSTLLGEYGHTYVGTRDSKTAMTMFRRESPNVVILDVMMPRVDGFELCRQIRAEDEDVPILFLSAKGDIIDKKQGFALGGDDYLVKPFNDEELVIRLEALMRRAARSALRDAGAAPDTYEAGEFVFDSARHTLTCSGHSVALTPNEYRLLYVLARHPGKVMSKEELIEAVWGSEYLDDSISIAVYVRKLREKIEDDPAHPKHLLTNWGVGYRFEP